MAHSKKLILVIIDGLGLRKAKQGNAFALAKTPTFDYLFKTAQHCQLLASGPAVGLPLGQMGNSEVGHLNIGAGRVVYTGLSLIEKALQDKTFATNKQFLKVFEATAKKQSTLHIMGLFSPGGVHAHEKHLFALLKSAYDYGLKKVKIHLFGDGRDVAPQSILVSLAKLEKLCTKFNYSISSIAGRFYAMDRDQIFARNQKAYDNLLALNHNTYLKLSDYIKQQYQKKVYDEFFEPAHEESFEGIKDDDNIIFFNFRPDRARQLSHFFRPSQLYQYQPSVKVKINHFLSMMKYEGINSEIAFSEMQIINPLGKVIADHNLKQLRVAETQKYAHVTYFIDGGQDIVYQNSERILVASQKVADFAQCPEMSALKITNAVISQALKYDLVILNYANPDMVGHTGNLKATIQALEILDQEIKRLWDFCEKQKIALFITADHGNAEITENEKGQPATKHTTSPVMLITNLAYNLKDGKLANVAPTILEYLDLSKPLEMPETSLFTNYK